MHPAEPGDLQLRVFSGTTQVYTAQGADIATPIGGMDPTTGEYTVQTSVELLPGTYSAQIWWISAVAGEDPSMLESVQFTIDDLGEVSPEEEEAIDPEDII